MRRKVVAALLTIIIALAGCSQPATPGEETDKDEKIIIDLTFTPVPFCRSKGLLSIL